uniref:Arm-like repeat-containing protein n=1 Tax=Melanopsichium pennsylvanicum 4 TaxID=1398559 RepID=A0A077R4G8_9BASI|nr:arm-like repeat-containing protein [Melanopsichium pennsylvanicum 4]
MPKSGFDPAKHQRKLHRHNPLSKSTSSSSAASSPATSSTINATLHTLQQASKATDSFASNDIIPLLANLPELNSSSSSSSSNNALPPTINLADKVWSLASVSLLLSTTPTQTASEVKSNRKLLLSHNLVGRLLAALSTHTEVDVRREASGALRNLCVDAGIDVRNQVINKGGVDIILSAMRWASNALGFDGAPSATPTNSFVDDAPTLEQDIQAKRQLLSKPLEKLNKKEKRHLTKLANTLGKTLELIAGRGLSPEDEHKLLSSSSSSSSTSFSNTAEHAMDTATTTTHTTRSSNRAEPFLSLDSNTRKGLIEMAENLVTLVWCLCESGDKAFAKLVSFRWLDADLVRGAVATGSELNAEGLASWLSSAIALGSRAANLLSTAAPDGSRSSNVSHRHESLGALTNEELSLLLDLALASGNALCALTDGGESVFINGFLSRNTLPTPSSIKDGSKTSFSKKKAGKLELQKQTTISAPPPPITLAQQPLAATNRLACIGRAISLLQACVETDESKIDKLKRYVLSQTTMLGVLSAGVLRNLASAVDSNPNVATATSTFSSRRRRHDDSNSLTSKNVFIPTHNGGGNANANANAEEGGMSLKKYEETVMLPTLTKLLARVEMTKLAHDLDGRADVSEAMLVSVSVDGDGGKDVDEAVLKMKLKGKAEEKAQTLMLALEILAELGAAGLDNDFISGLNDGQDGDDDEWLEDFDAPLGNDDEDDDDGEEREEEERVVVDEDMDDECESTLNGGEKMNDDHTNQDMMMAAERGDTFAEAVKRNTCLPFQAYAPILASLFASPTFTHALLTLARPFEASFPSLSSSPQQPSNDGSSSSSSTTAAAALLRGLHLRSLSVLNNVLLRLAAYSPPPPSQPATNPKQQRRIAAFRAWVTSEPQRSIFFYYYYYNDDDDDYDGGEYGSSD